MDQYNWLVNELLAEQRARELDARPPVASMPSTSDGGLRCRLASAIVRAGLRLDPAAGERVAPKFAPEARQ